VFSFRGFIWLIAIFFQFEALASQSSPQQASEQLDHTIIAQVDSLFARWDTQSTPGWGVGVVRRGNLLFSKGYGLANLEHQAPITPRSAFYMASASKQFTAACLAILVLQHQLSLADDVRAYLPGLPDYGTPITIGDLVYHTAGIREYTSLQLFSGQDSDFEQPYSNSDLIALAKRQKHLDIQPGTAFRYSSMGYVLLTEIIERVTDKSLDEFAREHLFTPLGMHNTRFDVNHASVVPRRVQSYRKTSGGYERYHKVFDVYGDGGLLTTVEDLARWDSAFYGPPKEGVLVGTPAWIELMTTPGRLTRGDKRGESVNYAMGLQFRKVFERKAIEHNGGMLGFTVDLVRFPEEELSVIVLGNHFDAWSTSLAYQIAGFILDKPEPLVHRSIESVPLTMAEQERYEGYYASNDRNFYRRVIIAPDSTLRFDWGEGDGLQAERLHSVGNHSFVIPARTMGWMSIAQQEVVIDPVSGRAEWIDAHGEHFELERYVPSIPQLLADIEPLLGTYYSEELETTYQFDVDGDRFTLQINRSTPIELFPNPAPGIIWNATDRLWIRFGLIRFAGNQDGEITGFHIGDRRVSASYFKRLGAR